MDLSCIISSGDLELYMLGMLPPEEAHQISQLALLFPEVQEELDRISGSLLHMVGSGQQEPSAALRGRVLQQLHHLKEESAEDTPVVPLHTGRHLHVNEHAATFNEAAETPVIAMRREPGRASWLGAAALIGVLLSLGAVIFLATKARDYRSAMASMEQNVKTLNRQVVTLQRDNLAASQMLEMLQSDVYKKIKLAPVPGKPQDALVQLFWNTQTKAVFVNEISLPAVPQGKQYQLWAIVDGKPVDAGMLQAGKKGVQQMKRFERAQAFAITLEQQGGSPVPTMEAMYVMGAA